MLENGGPKFSGKLSIPLEKKIPGFFSVSKYTFKSLGYRYTSGISLFTSLQYVLLLGNSLIDIYICVFVSGNTISILGTN
jgi:hypothetical protein